MIRLGLKSRILNTALNNGIDKWIGGAVWNLLATFAGFPVSGTHSIVGAVVGFSIVAKGFNSVKWIEIAKIGENPH